MPARGGQSTSSVTSPVVVLGPHRSGTSALAGWLAECGLWLGDVIEVGPDNPAGYHENRAVLSAHIDLLASMQRDWQCPPEWFDAFLFDLEPLRSAVKSLAGCGDRLWGIKDPRMLYLLPAWCHVVPAMTFVGTFRHPSAIADSLVRRNGFDRRFALDLAERQIERLHALWLRYRFPLIEFGLDNDSFAPRVRAVAEMLGLNPATASGSPFDPGLIHHQWSDSELVSMTDQMQPSAAYAALAEAAYEPLTRPSTVTAEDLASVLTDLVRPRRDRLSTRGPSFEERRRLCSDHAAEFAIEVAATACITPTDMSTRLEAGTATGNVPGTPMQPISHVVAAAVAEVGGSEAIEAVLQTYRSQVMADAIAVFDGFFTDEAPLPEDRWWPRSAVTSHRTRPPHHIHVDQLRAAAAVSGWYLATVADIGPGQGRRLASFVTNPTRRREQRTHEEWHQMVAERDTTIALQAGHIEHRDNLLAQIDERRGDEQAELTARLAEQATEIERLSIELADLDQVRRAEYERLLDDNQGLRHWVGELAAEKDFLAHRLHLAEQHHRVTLLSPRQVHFLKRVIPRPLVPLLQRGRRLYRRVHS
ncbi:MAG: hypothetical protein OES24_04860 [Acidimicrobiia bacterium]|nr:hypothetical protein [Acidimicrobiia bacterium]